MQAWKLKSSLGDPNYVQLIGSHQRLSVCRPEVRAISWCGCGGGLPVMSMNI